MRVQLMRLRFFLILVLWVLSDIGMAKVLIQAQVDGGNWQSSKAIYPLRGQEIRLRVIPVPEANIRWYQIRPNLDKIYKNANHPWEENAYQWVGFGKIDYERQELLPFRNQWEIELLSGHQLSELWERPSQYHQAEVGSFWVQVEVEQLGKVMKSPGIEAADSRGMSPEVFRISIRDGEGFLGYVTSFFNVPGVFGSVIYQSRHYIGVDCADVLVAAYHQWKNQPLKKDYNVAMLVSQLAQRKKFSLIEGVPDQEVKWGKDIFVGDLIAVRYVGARQYQHVGVMAADANENGLLDGKDRVLHAGPLPLHYSELAKGHFDGEVVILQPVFK